MFPWRASWLVWAALGGVVLCAQPPLIRVDVRLVNVIATVKNRAGNLVGTLGKDDFEIYDNGARQEIAFLQRQTEQALSIALLVDTSGSTAKEIGYEIDSAKRFLRALLAEGNPNDAVALYDFSYDVNEHPFTRNYTALEATLKRLERDLKASHAELGTSLHDAIFYASHTLEQREGRKVIIVVTDGGDTTSRHDVQQALKAAQLADAVIYPVVVMPITNEAGRNTGGEHALVFMAQGTGGRSFLPSNGAELDRTFSDIISELRTQYVLGFYPRNVPLKRDPFHTLDVKAKSPELRVSARNGYYGDAEGGAGTPGARVSLDPERKPAVPEKKKNRQEN